MARVSVVIPTFGRADDVARLLQELAVQETPAEEVIIVDDTPGDEVAVAATAAPGPVRVLRPDGPASLPRARNLGLDAARGDVVVFLDSDVHIAPTYLESMVAALDDERAPAAAQAYVPHRWRHRGIRGLALRLFLQGRNVGDRMRFRLPMRNTFPDRRPHGVVESDWLSGSNIALHRARSRGVRWDDSLERYALAEDVDLSLRLRAAGGRMLLVGHETVEEGAAPGGRVADRDLERMRIINFRRILSRHFPHRRWRLALTWQDIGWILQTRKLAAPAAFVRYVGDRIRLGRLARQHGWDAPELNQVYSFWQKS